MSTLVSREDFLAKYNTTNDSCWCPSARYNPDRICKHILVSDGSIWFSQDLVTKPRTPTLPTGVASRKAKSMLDNHRLSVEEVFQYRNELIGSEEYWNHYKVGCKAIESYIRRESYNTTDTGCLCEDHLRYPDRTCKHMWRKDYLARTTVPPVVTLVVPSVVIREITKCVQAERELLVEKRATFLVEKNKLRENYKLCSVCYSPHALPVGCCPKQLCVDCWSLLEKGSPPGNPCVYCDKPMAELVTVLMDKFKANF
jgi:hypothetical protein